MLIGEVFTWKSPQTHLFQWEWLKCRNIQTAHVQLTLFRVRMAAAETHSKTECLLHVQLSSSKKPRSATWAVWVLNDSLPQSAFHCHLFSDWLLILCSIKNSTCTIYSKTKSLLSASYRYELNFISINSRHWSSASSSLSLETTAPGCLKRFKMVNRLKT